MSAVASAPTTVGAALRQATERLRASGSPSARLDAELLLGHALGVERVELLAAPERLVDPGAAVSFATALERRLRGEPIAYLRERKEFYGLTFAVDRRVLIPRPETELLVELGVERAMARLERAASVAIIDVGTGSGAIAVAVAHELRRRGAGERFRISATDISADALAVARANAAAHGVAAQIDFLLTDLLPARAQPADIVLANLPYVPTTDIPHLPVAASFEPIGALDGGADGLAVIRRLLDQLPGVPATGGVALLEVGSDQVRAVRQAVELAMPGWSVTVQRDLGGQPRVIELALG